MTTARPNLLFVFSDQHRWCDLGAYGNRELKTPNFDNFAERAAKFNHCIANNPLCVPSRGNLLTGLYPLRHGAVTNDLPINPGAEGVGHVLSRGGYHTGYIGKWHLIGMPRRRPVQRDYRLGFDAEWKVCNCNHRYQKAYFYDEENVKHKVDGYEPVAQTDMAIDFIERNRARAEPWALYLSWGPPHDPYRAVPQHYLNLYNPAEISLRANVPEEIKVYDPRTTPLMFRIGFRLFLGMGQKSNREKMRRDLQGYYAHISALDEQFGRLLAALQKTGQLENTVIVYTSDHGDMLGSQGLTNKQLPYDESIRVPLLVYWYGRTHTQWSDELLGLVDLPVSIMSLLGLKFAGETDGRDLSSLFTDPAATGLDACYINDLVPAHQAEFRGDTSWRGVRTKRYTFARTPFDDGTLLFDNRDDPLQQNNLIDDPDYLGLRSELRQVTDDFTDRYDKLMPYPDLLREFGFATAWNKSQRTMRLPIIDEARP